MEHPTTAPWGMRITRADFDRLREGFQPQDIDDRWECRADDPDQQGRIVVRLRRSWTGSEQFALKVKGDDDGAEISEITWEGRDPEGLVTEAEAKSAATNLCGGLMGCEWTLAA